MSLAVLSLGSNIGDRAKNLNAALKELSQKARVIKTSQFYETKPYGFHLQPDFLNCAAILETSLKPEELLHELKEVEKKLGRVEVEKWHERTIDIDIIFYDSLVYNSPGLQIPHPDMQYREFVLKPIAEISPDFVHPELGKTVSVLLSELARMPYVDAVKTALGDFYIAVLGDTIFETAFHKLNGRRERNSFLDSVKEEFNRYFTGEKVEFKEFSLDYKRVPKFYKKVYIYLRKNITWGKTITYGELAGKVGCNRGARAVGNAMARNPFPIIVPCHRVLKSGNKLGGFGGGEEWKKYLLNLEGVDI